MKQLEQLSLQLTDGQYSLTELLQQVRTILLLYAKYSILSHQQSPLVPKWLSNSKRKTSMGLYWD